MWSPDVNMIVQSFEKSTFAMKCIVYSVATLLISVLFVVSAVEDTVPHRTSNDLYLDPCKAAGFWGDIALSDAEYRAAKKMLQNQMKNNTDSSSLMELQVDDPGTHSNTDAIGHYKNREEYKRQLQSDRNYLKKILKEKAATLKSPCEQ
ncbi:unnamed protein product, partial [Candidula unifasciata]